VGVVGLALPDAAAEGAVVDDVHEAPASDVTVATITSQDLERIPMLLR
jgi:hypothetical protein